MGLLRHQLGEVVLAAAEVFGDDDGGVVGRPRDDALDRILDRDGLAGLEIELGRRLLGGVLGDLERRIELDLAGVETLEQQVERHDLGQRGRMAQRVRVRRLQHLRRYCRRPRSRPTAANSLRRGRDGARAPHGARHVMHAQTPMVPRVGGIAGDGENRSDSGKTQNATAKPVAGFGYAPNPLRTPSLNARRAPVEAHPCSLLRDGASPRYAPARSGCLSAKRGNAPD